MSSSARTAPGVNWFRFAAPAEFYRLAGKLVPWFAALAGVLAGLRPEKITAVLVCVPAGADTNGDLELLLASISERQDELAANAISLGERLYARKPKAFERRLRSYWESWR